MLTGIANDSDNEHKQDDRKNRHKLLLTNEATPQWEVAHWVSLSEGVKYRSPVVAQCVLVFRYQVGCFLRILGWKSNALHH